jgi:hypothetical protein
MPDLGFSFPDRVPDQVGAHMGLGFDSICRRQQLRVVTELGCLPGVGIGVPPAFLDGGEYRPN